MNDQAGHWLADFFSVEWLPLLFIAGAGAMLFILHRRNGKKSSPELVGLTLGVILGFVSEVVVANFEDFRKDQQLKEAAGILLRHDAESIYREMSAAEKDRTVPSRIDFYYWNELKKDHSFILLASDSRFAKIFQGFWEFEEINDLIDKGRAGDKEAARTAVKSYQEALRHQAHRELLLQFTTADEIAAREKTLVAGKVE
jgi:hypothetical protein